MILFLTKDLMMSSHANAHAREHNVSLKTSDSTQNALEIIRENRPHLLLVDLQMPGLDIEMLGNEIRELADSVTPLTVAYAQHVNVELLEQARMAGFDQVLTRGQLNSEISRIIADSA